MTSALVIPIFQKGELIDISSKVMCIRRIDGEGLICADNIRANVEAHFTVRINPTEQDILQVARGIGCSHAGNSKTLAELFTAKFTEALKVVCKQYTFADLLQNLDRLKEQSLEIIGTDLNGYNLEDLAIAEFSQTPIDKLAPQNILDAEGILRITEVTAAEAMRVNELERQSEKALRKFAAQNPETVRRLAEYAQLDQEKTWPVRGTSLISPS
jgi:uncharacterized membrane protein YqiK